MSRWNPREATYINIRIRVTRRMRVSEARRLLRRAYITGYVPEGIEIAYIDWRKGTGKVYTYEGDEALDALMAARAILLSDQTKLRLSIVDMDDEDR